LEKLASVGLMVSGVMHDIRNPLNFINNFSATSIQLIDELTELLGPHLANVEEEKKQEILTLFNDLTQDIQTIKKHGQRAESIIQNMLAYSRGKAGAPERTDIKALLMEAFDLAGYGQRGQNPGFQVHLEKHFEDSDHSLQVIPQEIIRVFINLFANAFFATGQKQEAGNDGRSYQPAVAISTKHVEGGLEIRIRDNGMGIPAGNLAHLFTPFFTTKPIHQGTGLGLSICREIIVDHHGGRMDVQSNEGEFTEFVIWLPSQE